MKKSGRDTIALALWAALSMGVPVLATACSDDDPIEDAAEDVEDAVDDVEDELDR